MALVWGQVSRHTILSYKDKTLRGRRYVVAELVSVDSEGHRHYEPMKGEKVYVQHAAAMRALRRVKAGLSEAEKFYTGMVYEKGNHE